MRYRLALILKGQAEPIVLYDNHHPKGHHRHVRGIEQPYDFVNIDHLIDDFMNDTREFTEGDR